MDNEGGNVSNFRFKTGEIVKDFVLLDKVKLRRL